MKLLLDQNISYRLIKRLSDLTDVEIKHISRVGLPSPATDREIWSFAETHGYVIITNDEDFCEIQALRGFPPYVVWLRMGNVPTDVVEERLCKNIEHIREMFLTDEIGIVEIY